MQPDLFAMAMNTEDSLKEYLGLQLRVPLLGRLGPLARTLDFVANAAPGVKEILTVGKVAYEVRERHYDLVVVDAAASGHITGQLASPKAINDLVHVGMVHDQTQWMLDILQDPARTGVLIVTTPEEMPVTETIELAGRLDEETGVDLAAVVVNRVLPELFGRGEEEVFERLRSSKAEAVLADRAGPAWWRCSTPPTSRCSCGAPGPATSTPSARRCRPPPPSSTSPSCSPAPWACA